MSKKKILFAVLVGLTASFVAPTLNASAAETTSVSTDTIQTGWVKSGDKWYYYNQDGIMRTNDWIQDSGKWYHLDITGAMETGWFKDTDGKWYHLDNSGAMETGWFKDSDDNWYHLDNSGAMETGWFKDTDGNWYYLSTKEGGPYGSMQTGWFYDNDQYNAWFYLNPNSEGAPKGAVRTGKIEVKGVSYYLKANGAMAASEVVAGQYYASASGALLEPKETKYMESTAYSGGGITASGRPVAYNPNGISTISVDPSVIPFGTLVYVEGYGVAVAADTGGAIKGNIIDVYFDSYTTADNWERRYGVKVDILAYPGQWQE